jgi:hypothetical protein
LHTYPRVRRVRRVRSRHGIAVVLVTLLLCPTDEGLLVGGGALEVVRGGGLVRGDGGVEVVTGEGLVGAEGEVEELKGEGRVGGEEKLVDVME